MAMTTGIQTTTDVSEENSGPDYGAVEIPAKPPTEYHYTERRAELLQMIEEVGHPDALNQTELADRYGVTQSQISKDLDRLATHVRERLEDRDRRAFTVDAVLQKCLRELLKEGEYRKASKTALEYEEWAAGFADLEELHARVKTLEQAENHDSFTL
jgi:predicted transcriptional regulator